MLVIVDSEHTVVNGCNPSVQDHCKEHKGPFVHIEPRAIQPPLGALRGLPVTLPKEELSATVRMNPSYDCQYGLQVMIPHNKNKNN